jgi:hypothetical protein
MMIINKIKAAVFPTHLFKFYLNFIVLYASDLFISNFKMFDDGF